MTFKTNGIAIMSQSGIPFMYGSGDVDTVSSNETRIVATDSSGSDVGEDDEFGYSVAVGSGRVVVGAPKNNDAAPYSGDGTDSGSAYIYDLDGTIVKKINSASVQGGEQHGYSVAVGSSRVVVGAPFYDYGTDNVGAVRIFDLNGSEVANTSWVSGDGQNQLYAEYIIANGAGYQFGTSVAAGSGRIVVGDHVLNSPVTSAADDGNLNISIGDIIDSAGGIYIHDTPDVKHHLDILD